MTDEYRERIIKWLSGNYDIEQSSTEPLFQELEKTTTDINTYMKNALGYIQGRDGKGNELDVGFIYGLDNNDKGVILIVDNDFNILQVITEFDTGTNFSEFVCLNIDTVNGNIYGVDYSSSKYRFILLNNFLIKTPSQVNYEVKLRNSYFLETTNGFEPQFVEKKPNESFYIMTGTSSTYQPIVATYKIEVGSTNEYQQYTYSTVPSGAFWLKAYNIIWSGDTFTEKIGFLNFASTQYQDVYDLKYYEYTFNGETISAPSVVEIDEISGAINPLTVYSGVQITNNEVFVKYNKFELNDSYLVKIDGNNIINYYEIEGDSTLDYNYTGIKLIKLGNTIYFYGYENIDSPNDNTQANIKLHFGVISSLNGSPYVIKKEYNAGQIMSIVLYTGHDVFYVSNVYNLYTYHLTGSRSSILVNTQQIYNPLNYNFEDYEDISSLVPHSVWLYSDDKIVFARNLYNKTLNGNTTMSTVEVPNMMLNDISITPQELLGMTNGSLVNSTEEITKNIYEDLFINFYNTLTMQNQNTALFIPNLVGASRLNNSISQTMDYSNAKIGKVKLNYSDDTSYIKAINPATRISQFVYQFSFQVYVPNSKTITSIELLSNDEGTSYQTINGSNLISGKTYKITQNVEIEEG